MEKSNSNRPNVSNDRIVLNVGGIKYETYRSTLTAYPDTLLGTMFQERNKSLLVPTNENEYFFDRDGLIFRYIIQFYRTGEIFWAEETNFIYEPTQNVYVNRRELELELDYFQVPYPGFGGSIGGIDEFGVVELVDGFLNALDNVAYHIIKKYHATIKIQFRLGMIDYDDVDQDMVSSVSELLLPFKLVGYKILCKFDKEIAAYLLKNHKSIDSRVMKRTNKGYYEIRLSMKDFNSLDDQLVFKYSKLSKVVDPSKIISITSDTFNNDENNENNYEDN
ncbi:hypothetical protein Glove_25g51 [Diversispora epigaea]|uniref:Potassium channel tetramerisation-type BTB domain-containing protein n=1 Tax=Diversispora epigaea TaxID=1348612 RepID=A0A397JJQ1_9GLOM|nr:hypothetical protein Glove_25g51 [Diversispora epigaea]